MHRNNHDLAVLMTPWGRAVPTTDHGFDQTLDHFGKLKQRHPGNAAIDRILDGLGQLMRDRTAAQVVSH